MPRCLLVRARVVWGPGDGDGGSWVQVLLPQGVEIDNLKMAELVSQVAFPPSSCAPPMCCPRLSQAMHSACLMFTTELADVFGFMHVHCAQSGMESADAVRRTRCAVRGAEAADANTRRSLTRCSHPS
eukprot:3941194-Rhodomonas_salina.1